MRRITLRSFRRMAMVAGCLLAAGFAPESAPAEGAKLHPPGIDLPDGSGRSLLLAACTRCHDLRGLPAYKGYWNRERWRAMIETMVQHGAPLDSQQADELAGYLALHFGRVTP
jgi:hypothetical protein